jgi:hypothetical protein
MIKSSFLLHQLDSLFIVFSRQIIQNLYTVFKLNVFWDVPKNWIFQWSCTNACVFTQFTYWICQNTTVSVKFPSETMQMYSMTNNHLLTFINTSCNWSFSTNVLCSFKYVHRNIARFCIKFCSWSCPQAYASGIFVFRGSICNTKYLTYKPKYNTATYIRRLLLSHFK